MSETEFAVRPKARLKTTAKAIKLTLVLDPAPLAGFEVPTGQPRINLYVEVGGRTMRADLNAKSARKAIASIRQLGADSVVCIVQGKLGQGDAIDEAGLSVMPKGGPKQQPSEAESTVQNG